MIGSPPKVWKWLLPTGLAIVGFSLIAAAAPRHQPAQLQAADNPESSKNQSAPTSDQQFMNPDDRALTQKIRKAIHHDKSLSNCGKNITILTQYGQVTLRGPVGSEQEKLSLHAKAAEMAGQENVTNQLQVIPLH